METSKKGCAGWYRFGFGGHEKDNEWAGNTGRIYTTDFRQYDASLGRWFSVDPLASGFPWQSTYVGMNNNPILLADPNGDSTFVKAVDDGKYTVYGGN